MVAEVAATEVLVTAPMAAGQGQSEGKQAVVRMEGQEMAAAGRAAVAGVVGVAGGCTRRASSP